MTKVICTECAFRGEPLLAFQHYYLTRHAMTYKGVIQKWDGAVRDQDDLLAAKRGREQATRKESAA